MGAVWSVMSAFPIAGLMALLFRFPVPFVGYMSGFEAIIPAMIAVIVYGVLLGGLVLVALFGALGGAFAAKLTMPNNQRSVKWVVRIVSVTITTACLLALSVLDMVIGPW